MIIPKTPAPHPSGGALFLLPRSALSFKVNRVLGRYRSGQTGQTVNLLAYAFAGSSPARPTTLMKRILIVIASTLLMGCSQNAQPQVVMPAPTDTSYQNEEFAFSFAFPAGAFQEIKRIDTGLMILLLSGKTTINVYAYTLETLPEWRSLASITEKGSPYKAVTIKKQKAWQYPDYDDKGRWITYTAYFAKTHAYWIEIDQPTKNTDKAFVDQVLKSFTFTP